MLCATRQVLGRGTNTDIRRHVSCAADLTAPELPVNSIGKGCSLQIQPDSFDHAGPPTRRRARRLSPPAPHPREGACFLLRGALLSSSLLKNVKVAAHGKLIEQQQGRLRHRGAKGHIPRQASTQRRRSTTPCQPPPRLVVAQERGTLPPYDWTDLCTGRSTIQFYRCQYVVSCAFRLIDLGSVFLVCSLRETCV